MGNGYFSTRRKKQQRKFITQFVLPIFFLNFCISAPPAQAQTTVKPLANLPPPGEMVTFSEAYQPMVLMGVTVDPADPLKFNFIVDKGDSALEGAAFEEESQRLIKYFLAALTIPDEEVWVNLSPYEKDLMIPAVLGVTEMGKNLLEEDYILKQITSSLTHPEEDLGKKFWERVYQTAYEKFGTTDLPYNTFSKVWIVPGKASVAELDGTAYIEQSFLKVMSEEDYLAVKKNLNNKEIGTDQIEAKQVEEINSLSAQIMTEVILPEIEKEINRGKNFAQVRQVYNSVILATWFKKSLRDSLLAQVYVDKNKVAGVHVDDMEAKEKIYNQYLQALQKGSYNLEKEDYDAASNMIYTRRYFSGGAYLSIPGQTSKNLATAFDTAIEKGGVDTASLRNSLENVRLFDTATAEGRAQRTEFFNRYDTAQKQGPAQVRQVVQDFFKEVAISKDAATKLESLQGVALAMMPSTQEKFQQPQQVAEKMLPSFSADRFQTAQQRTINLTSAQRDLVGQAVTAIRQVEQDVSSGTKTIADLQQVRKEYTAPLQDIVRANPDFAKSLIRDLPVRPEPIMVEKRGQEATPVVKAIAERIRRAIDRGEQRYVGVETKFSAQSNNNLSDRTRTEISGALAQKYVKEGRNPVNEAVKAVATDMIAKDIVLRQTRAEERPAVEKQMVELQDMMKNQTPAQRQALLENPAPLVASLQGKELGRVLAGSSVPILQNNQQQRVRQQEARQTIVQLTTLAPKQLVQTLQKAVDTGAIAGTEKAALEAQITELRTLPDLKQRDARVSDSLVKDTNSNFTRLAVTGKLDAISREMPTVKSPADLDLSAQSSVPEIQKAVLSYEPAQTAFMKTVPQERQTAVQNQLTQAADRYAETGDIKAAFEPFKDLQKNFEALPIKEKATILQPVITPVITPVVNPAAVQPAIMLLGDLDTGVQDQVFRQAGITNTGVIKNIKTELQLPAVREFVQAKNPTPVQIEAVQTQAPHLAMNLPSIRAAIVTEAQVPVNFTKAAERTQIALMTDQGLQRDIAKTPEAQKSLNEIVTAFNANPTLQQQVQRGESQGIQEVSKMFQDKGTPDLQKAVNDFSVSVARSDMRMTQARWEVANVASVMSGLEQQAQTKPQLSQAVNAVRLELSKMPVTERVNPQKVSDVIAKVEQTYPNSGFREAVQNQARNLATEPIRVAQMDVKMADQIYHQPVDVTLAMVNIDRGSEAGKAFVADLDRFRSDTQNVGKSPEELSQNIKTYPSLVNNLTTATKEIGIDRLAMRSTLSSGPLDTGREVEKVGGIDFSAGIMNLMVQGEDRRISVPISKEMIEKLNIDGLSPEIIRVVPITQGNIPGV